eukprot:gb/GECG01000254.1/.p1 GENE.gb/GECG01000254.1/~~gb/GECG01000254.1/.p1  ORF type:complete len:708 (+),score=97.62 gb/GECG01000254.1/:1-2124(+)
MGGSESKEAYHGSVVMPNTADHAKGLGEVRRNAKYASELKPYFYDDAQTLYGAFERGRRLAGEKPCLGYRQMEDGVAGEFVWFTYNEIAEKRDNIGSGLLHLDACPPNDDGYQLVGIYSKNRYEWVVTEQACNAYKLILVPLYDTLGPEAISFIMNQTGMHSVCCSAVETKTLIKTKKEKGEDMKHFTNIFQFEDVTEEQREEAKQVGLTLRSFSELAEIGKGNPQKHREPEPDDLATIVYTSGTTGNPKGVMTTHKNLLSDASGALYAGVHVDSGDVHLSYLPLAHAFERLVMTFVLMNGACAGFFQGDVRKLTEDIAKLRPTIFPSVPRLYNKIYDKITGKFESLGGMKKSLFESALEAKKYWLKKGGHLTHGWWDLVILNKVKKNLGLDRCKVMLTGSAPIAPHVMEFLRVVFGCPVLEGYGQTECSAAATVSTFEDQASLGHVGVPLACNEVRLESVNEMGYLVTDEYHGREVDENGNVIREGIRCYGRGEVCFRGPNVFLGYYKNPEKTQETLDSDEWLHSGDVGLWDENGNLRIFDRIKNIFKLAQGEYVAAEKIENVYMKSPFVAQIFVYGNSYQSSLVAIVVPDQDYVDGNYRNTEAGKQFEGRSFEELCNDENFKQVVLDDMRRVGKDADLRGFEKVVSIHLEPKPWTPEDLLTPSFKLKRAPAQKQYQKAIDQMYEQVGGVAGQKNIHQESAGATES